MSSIVVMASSIYGLCTANFIISNYYQNIDNKILIVYDFTKTSEAGRKLIKYINANANKFAFTKIIYLNDVIAPYHPVQLNIKDFSNITKSIFYSVIGIDFCDEMLVESIQVSPAQVMVQLFGSAKINIYADGVMCYSPTRVDLPQSILSRINNVYYIDLITDVKPLLLLEAHPTYIPIDANSLKPVFKSLENKITKSNQKKNVLIIGQYLADLNLVSHEEEIEYYYSMLLKAYDEYHDSVNYIFRMHPSCIQNYKYALRAKAMEDGISVSFDEDYMPVECRYNSDNLEKVYGVFSTSLFTLSKLTTAKIQSMHCEDFYEKLTPWFNSNRVPVVLSAISFDEQFARLKQPSIIYSILLLHALSYQPKKFSQILTQILMFKPLIYTDKTIVEVIPEIFSGEYLANMFVEYKFIVYPCTVLKNNIKPVKKVLAKPVPKNSKPQIISEEKHLLELVNKNKNDHKARRLLAEIYISKGNYQKAAGLLAQACKLLPDNKNVYSRYKAVNTSNSIHWSLEMMRICEN